MAISAAELRRWRLYWEEEPWGAYRDNLHAAMIISQLLRPNVKDGVAPPLKNFLLMHPEDRKAEGAEDFILKLDMLARKQARDARKAAAAAKEAPKIVRRKAAPIARPSAPMVKRRG